MCHFHQKSIVRRYITNKPKTACGQDLKQLMAKLSTQDPQDFIDRFYDLIKTHEPFLKERNEQGAFAHKKVRSAVRSIKTNLPYLFVYKEITTTTIPHTTNQLEGVFAHLKERIKIHRGMAQNRKQKAIQFFLKTTGKNKTKKP